MSLTRRIIDLAKTNLNALLEKAAAETDPRRRLAELSDAELEEELARRRAARVAEERVTAARAKVDGTAAGAGAGTATGTGTRTGGGTGAGDRAERERQAKEREARVRAAREARDREAREREARARQQQAGPRPGAGAGPRPSSGGGTQRGRDPQVAAYYARLELPYGASWEEVKAAYRRMMRKYHPDLHGKSPEKLKAATEVSQALTQAYNELEKALLGGPNKR